MISTSNWQLYGLAAYFLLFTTAVFGIGVWLTKRRREKPPLEFKLLRGPGESLRQRINRFNEDLLFHLYWAAVAPLGAALAVFFLLVWLTPKMRLDLALAITAAAAFPVLLISGRWAVKNVLRFRDDRLGYLGERVVGEWLQPLTSAGYRVFHDVPAEAGGKKFNVDHVVVGPGGVFAIETKTRRKGRTRPGFEAHKVAYDGRQLIWPWGEDDFGVRKAEVRARWLSEWLNKMTGLRIAAKPVLALPGWYVVPKGIGPVLVVNHKQLEGAILRAEQDVLSNKDIDLVARQLDELCRDVDE